MQVDRDLERGGECVLRAQQHKGVDRLPELRHQVKVACRVRGAPCAAPERRQAFDAELLAYTVDSRPVALEDAVGHVLAAMRQRTQHLVEAPEARAPLEPRQPGVGVVRDGNRGGHTSLWKSGFYNSFYFYIQRGASDEERHPFGRPSVRPDVHDPAIPDVRFTDLYGNDPVLQRLLQQWMGPDHYEALQSRFHDMGAIAADATPLSALADKHRPTLETHDAQGHRIDQVVYHPSYHWLEEMSYGNGIVGIKYDPDFLAQHRNVRHLTGFTLGYLFGQTECSLFCPICMTDGVGRVLERHAKGDPIAEETIRHISATDMDELWQGAMFLTEIQGGSDVGANAVQARQDGDRWFLSGDKWFCSNVDADAILALARMPGQTVETGTKGLGLFLVLRQRPDGNGDTIRIHRLKDKLGVASMPTGECTFEDTEAFLIGGAGEGFKQMAEMLNLSRLYNAIASVAGMRRGAIEALAYGRERDAFGKTLDELPLWRASMADLAAETIGATLVVFETVRTLDAADCGDTEAQSLVRLLTPVIKGSTGNLAVFTISQCMEAIGGNAYIEEHIMPRLLRDAQVLPIWEGTTNVLALDALRAMQKTGAQELLVARVQRALEGAPPSVVEADPGLIDGIRADLNGLVALSTRMAKADAVDAQRVARGWADKAFRTLAKALCVEAAGVDGLKDIMLAAARRLHARSHSTAPIAGTYSAVLDGTEEPLLEGTLPR